MYFAYVRTIGRGSAVLFCDTNSSTVGVHQARAYARRFSLCGQRVRDHTMGLWQSQTGKSRSAAQKSWCWSVKRTEAASCKTRRHPVYSSNLKGHLVAQHAGVTHLQWLLLVLHLLDSGHITTYPSRACEGST